MQRAMDTWSSVAGIKFVEVRDDGSIVAGSANPYPGVGHIRIGAFPIVLVAVLSGMHRRRILLISIRLVATSSSIRWQHLDRVR